MPDYREMYLTLMRGVEQAERILVETQRKCEKLYLSSEEPELYLLPKVSMENPKKQDCI